MALIWQTHRNNRNYRVTRAGASTRLYTNGVFHSQYNPRQPVAGNLWDLLLIPAFMHPDPASIARVLVLGVGGGAVIRQLNVFLQPTHIVGVDLDPIHLRIARRFFGVRHRNTELLAAEAKSWLTAYRGAPFDLIIEDLFCDSIDATGTADPVRAIAADTDWLELLSRNLTDEGVLVLNFESGRSLGRSACRSWTGSGEPFAAAYRLSSSAYENAIAALVRQPLVPGQLTAVLSRWPLLDQKRKSCRLRFEYRRL